MENSYRLQIRLDPNPSVEIYNSITELLGTNPTKINYSNFPDEIPETWTYIVIEKKNDPYYDFINNFLDILENKYAKLADLGIQREDISVWYFYEYDSQCNMEFNPLRLKRLGDNGITLCITCWDSGK